MARLSQTTASATGSLGRGCARLLPERVRTTTPASGIACSVPHRDADPPQLHQARTHRSPRSTPAPAPKPAMACSPDRCALGDPAPRRRDRGRAVSTSSRAMIDRLGRAYDEMLARPVADVGLDDLYPLARETQCVKLVTNRAAIDVVDRALSVTGGAGYMTGHPSSRALPRRSRRTVHAAVRALRVARVHRQDRPRPRTRRRAGTGGKRSIEVGSVDRRCRVRRRARYETMSEPRVHTDLLHAIEASSMIARPGAPDEQPLGLRFGSHHDGVGGAFGASMRSGAGSRLSTVR